MTDEQYERKLSTVRDELLERIDKFSRAKRAIWTAGDLVVGGGPLLARSQGHDDIRELIATGIAPPAAEEPESQYKEPERI